MSMSQVGLSKSKYAAYCQCPKLLWLSQYRSDEATPDPQAESLNVHSNWLLRKRLSSPKPPSLSMAIIVLWTLKLTVTTTQKKRKRPIRITSFFLLLCTSYIVPLYFSASFLDALVFLYCLRGDSSRSLCAVASLSIRRSRADRPPCLATRHSECGGDTNTHDW